MTGDGLGLESYSLNVANWRSSARKDTRDGAQRTPVELKEAGFACQQTKAYFEANSIHSFSKLREMFRAKIWKSDSLSKLEILKVAFQIWKIAFRIHLRKF